MSNKETNNAFVPRPQSPVPSPQSLVPLLFVTCYLLFIPCSLLFAQVPSGLDFSIPHILISAIETAPEIGSRAAVMVDAETGTVVYAKNASDEIPPASLAKLMTMHLVLNEINEGRATLDDIVPLSKESWAVNQPPRSSLMFLAPGQKVTLRELMLGLAVPSGNDAAVAAALYIAPSVDDFANMMTMEARRMGLAKTTFVEPSGISEDNMTTAAEFTAFCMEYLRLHPYTLSEFHSVHEFAYPKAENVPESHRNNPRTIVQLNRNNLLGAFPGADGLKTGYIDEAGYNIALTAQRKGTRFITVILGAPAGPGGARIRDRDGTKLLSWAFENFRTVRPEIPPFEPVKLWKGRDKQVAFRIAEPTVFTAPLDRAASLRYAIRIKEPLIAPLPAFYPVGQLILADDEGELRRVQLVTEREYQQGNIFKRIWHSIRLLFRKKL
ncbi:MAG: D-alanyl-D-alanine carboxypeptidase [Treponema sp.]|nr:D-alanyl-D-alanine carboxypeptidase [Treponema sp.]